MDFIKDTLGVEVQFGKYSFMAYNVCAKMTIFRNQQPIEAGIEIAPIEIVPVGELADQMSSGVSYYEQIVWDLEHRGEADIDIPVLVLGIALTDQERDFFKQGRTSPRSTAPPKPRGTRPGPKRRS